MTITSEFKIHLVTVPILVHEVPIDNSGEVLKVSSSGIAVIDVVSVLPDIDSQKRLVAIGQWVSSIGCVNDGNILTLLAKPGPARAEVAKSLSWKILEEVINAAPLANNEILQLSSKLTLVGRDAVPVEGVVPMLGGIVEDLLVLAAA